MTDPARDRLLDWHSALDRPFVRVAMAALVIVLATVPLLILALSKSGKISPTLQKELWARYRSWLLFIPMMIGPILLGPGATMLAVALMSLLCYREFARATGLFRERLVSSVVAAGILAITFAVADHWYELFVSLAPITVGFIAATALLSDRPTGYIQRVALGVFAFMLFGVSFGHLGYFANDVKFREVLIWLIACVELNDIFAYMVGKTLGRRKLAPNTSPNKTVAGSLGAIVLTTILAAVTGHWVFQNTAIDFPAHLIVLGLTLSITGQLGDLTLSSIKRDLGIKDWASTFPGHGGLLDRFNSLLFAAPATFHFVGYFLGVGLNQPVRIFKWW
jgi:phosphatidate cytidylyltransferase